MPHYLMILREGEEPIKTINLTASVFSENPKLMIVVVIAAVAVLAATGTVVIKKVKKQKNNTEEK